MERKHTDLTENLYKCNIFYVMIWFCWLPIVANTRELYNQLKQILKYKYNIANLLKIHMKIISIHTMNIWKKEKENLYCLITYNIRNINQCSESISIRAKTKDKLEKADRSNRWISFYSMLNACLHVRAPYCIPINNSSKYFF